MPGRAFAEKRGPGIMYTVRMFGAAMLLLAGPACAADLPQIDEPQLVMPVSRGALQADRPTVDRCNAAIAEWAAQYNPIGIETSLVQPVQESAGGARIATLFVKIDYPGDGGGVEPRSA